MQITALQKKRLAYQPIIPRLLKTLSSVVLRSSLEKSILPKEVIESFVHSQDLCEYQLEKKTKNTKSPLRVGVVFSGGQASGGHNVITGLYDGLVEIHKKSQLFGFINGPSGLVDNRYVQLTSKDIDAVRNQGGFDLIGSGRTKIETEAQFLAVAKNVKRLKLDALLIIGGDDSNTNAAFLAEYFLQHEILTCVVGCPKTIDGDLQSDDIEISFGFDSATKTYSELIGNIARDALSAKKYYHFIKLMGRSASHITLECALQTNPNLALMGEEEQSLSQIIQNIVSLIVERKKTGKDYGVILLPEGLIEFIPEFKKLIHSLNALLSKSSDPQKAIKKLAKIERELFNSLPEKIQQGLLLDRDSHGNVQLSQIETEQLLIELVKKELNKRDIKIHTQAHFFGYEGRACYPSNFDANYCYALGRLAALSARDRITGVILTLKNLNQPAFHWIPKAVPIVKLMKCEMRGGKNRIVVAKTLVDLKGWPYRQFKKDQSQWRIQDCYQMPGPIQFFGDDELTNSSPVILTD